jgi:hypothetical protein
MRLRTEPLPLFSKRQHCLKSRVLRALPSRLRACVHVRCTGLARVCVHARVVRVHTSAFKVSSSIRSRSCFFASASPAACHARAEPTPWLVPRIRRGGLLFCFRAAASRGFISARSSLVGSFLVCLFVCSALLRLSCSSALATAASSSRLTFSHASRRFFWSST